MNILKIQFIIFPLLLLFSGCSSLHDVRTISEQIGGGGIIPEDAAKIYVKPLQQGKQWDGFNNEFSRRLKRTINLDGRLAVVESADVADLVLDATTCRYAEENVRFDETGRAVLRRISITVSVTLVQSSTGRVIIKGKETEHFTEYNPDSAIIDEVYRELADRASAAVLSIILTGWASGTGLHDTGAL